MATKKLHEVEIAKLFGKLSSRVYIHNSTGGLKITYELMEKTDERPEIGWLKILTDTLELSISIENPYNIACLREYAEKCDDAT